MTSHDDHTHRILTRLESGQDISQRSLSRDLGIALGLTNLLIKRLVRKGWVRVIHIKPNRVRYLLTPTGLAEKARMSRNALQSSVRFYADARDRIRARFEQLSAQWPHGPATARDGKRIAFYGTGEVAEIGYICLQGTDLLLVAAIADDPRPFFDVPVFPPSQLTCDPAWRARFDRLVVMSFSEADEVRSSLQTLGIPPGQVFWV